ncbi:MAG: tRNA (cytidine(34)-2'-O)-methyltransferase [Pseudomonadales bacterium]
MPFHIVLYEPEIPPNTGNVMRLAANMGATLHLVEPLGFALDDARMRRAGLDYREWADVRVHPDLETAVGDRAFWAISTRGGQRYTDAVFGEDDVFVFGPETRGLPQSVLDSAGTAQVLRLPMQPGSRSLNLSNAVAVVLFEAWRQIGFRGGQ